MGSFLGNDTLLPKEQILWETKGYGKKHRLTQPSPCLGVGIGTYTGTMVRS
jgi:hypothetical protein